MTFEKFGEVMTGAKAGDSRTLDGTLPDDYEKEDLRGKKATVEVTVKQIKRMVLPEMSKETAFEHGLRERGRARASSSKSV